MLLANDPWNDMDIRANEELYFVHAATLDDELQPIIVFTIQVFLIVVVAFLIGSATGQYIGQIEAEDDFPSVLLSDEEHGIE